MNKYYLHDGETQIGPFTLEELKQHSVNRETMVWTEGMDAWKKANEVEDLKQLFASMPPPFKPQATAKQTADNLVITPKKPSRIKYYLLGAVVLIYVGVLFYNKTKNDAIDESIKKQEMQEFIEAGELREKEQEKKEALDKRKQYIRNHITKYFTTKTNYEANILGGISNAMVYFYNSCEYPIDEVIVRVYCIKDNGEVYTHNDVLLRNIAAKGQAVEKSINTERGTKLELEIVSIRAKSMDFCFSGIKQGVDPYYCVK